MRNEARVQEIARLIRQHTGMQNGCVETAARAIAPLIESARAEGERDMRERCAVVVKGRVYKDRYREWPGIIEGNRRADSEIVSAVDALAATLDALPLASDGDSLPHYSGPPDLTQPAGYGCKRAGGFVNSNCMAMCDCHVTMQLPSPTYTAPPALDLEVVTRLREIAERDEAKAVTVRADDLRAILALMGGR